MYLDWSKESNQVEINGVNHGPLHVVRVDHDNRLLILKADGYQADGYYMPAEFEVWEINQFVVHENYICMQGNRLISFDSRNKTYCSASNVIKNAKESEDYLTYSQMEVLVNV